MKWRPWSTNTWGARSTPYGFCAGRYGDGLYRLSVARRLAPERQECEQWQHPEAFRTLQEAQDCAERIAAQQ
jgi:hypothetical protein